MITAPAPCTQSSATLNFARANRLDVEIRDRQDAIDVSRSRIGRPASTVPSSSHVARVNPVVEQRPHRGAFARLEKQPGRPDAT